MKTRTIKNPRSGLFFLEYEPGNQNSILRMPISRSPLKCFILQMMAIDINLVYYEHDAAHGSMLRRYNMQSVQEMLRDIHSAIAGTQDGYKSIQEMIFDIWQCIEVDEETGEKYLKVKVSEE